MRTTLDIEEDILFAAKELAEKEGSTAGRIISLLARRGLSAQSGKLSQTPSTRGGIPLVRSRGEVVTCDRIRKLMDQEGI